MTREAGRVLASGAATGRVSVMVVYLNRPRTIGRG
jgi:hypothetical protein